MSTRTLSLPAEARPGIWRYDWNRYGRPGVARFSRLGGWWITLSAVVTGPAFLWFALGDWTLMFPALLLISAAVAHRVLLRKVYGIRPAAPPAPAPPAGGWLLPGGPVIVQSAGTTMADLGLGFARLVATLGPCPHPDAEPVELLTGETVAWLCPGCDRQLPAGWAA